MTITRTPTFAGGGITEDEKRQMADHTALWVKRAMRTEPIDCGKATSAIKALYAAADLAEPTVVVVPSPRVMALAYGLSAGLWHLHGKGSLSREATREATEAATYAATEAATDAVTRAATYAATRAATLDATHAATAAATYAATGAATAAATEAATDEATTPGSWYYRLAEHFTQNHNQAKFLVSCAPRWWNVYQGGNMWAAYPAYLSAARDILGLQLPEHEKFKAWEDATIEGGFRVMHEKFCIVSDFPELIKVDNENRPHCENGPSHRWRDGWSLYHWHGVQIPGEWVSGMPPSAKEALTWENIEQRRAACEIVGWAKILEQLNARTIDEDGDEEIGTLLEVDIPDSGPERFLQVRCGTGRTFALPVPREMKTAIQASAWTYGIDDLGNYKPEIRT